MREIKFRAKLKGSKEWIYGTYYKLEITHRIVDETTITEYDIDENTLGQYIGLKDKDGKEIYEGDILGDLYDGEWTPKGEVKYSEDEARFYLWHKEEGIIGTFDDNFECDTKEMIVMGNIYENPDLLTFPEEKETNSG